MSTWFPKDRMLIHKESPQCHTGNQNNKNYVETKPHKPETKNAGNDSLHHIYIYIFLENIVPLQHDKNIGLCCYFYSHFSRINQEQRPQLFMTARKYRVWNMIRIVYIRGYCNNEVKKKSMHKIKWKQSFPKSEKGSPYLNFHFQIFHKLTMITLFPLLTLKFCCKIQLLSIQQNDYWLRWN